MGAAVIKDRNLYRGLIVFMKTFKYFERKDLLFIASGCEFELNLNSCPTQTLRDLTQSRIIKEVFQRAYC